MRLQDIAIHTNTPLDVDMVLLEKFKGHDRIHWDPKTDLYSYKVYFHHIPTPLIIGLTQGIYSMILISVTKPLYSSKFKNKRERAAAYRFAP